MNCQQCKKQKWWEKKLAEEVREKNEAVISPKNYYLKYLQRLE